MRRIGFAAAFDRIASRFRAQTRAQRDLLVIVALTLPLFWFVVATDAFDRASRWVHRHAFWELEELLVLLFCLGLAAAVYAFRRVGVSQEIAQRHVAEEEAHRLARYDVLTGLANRRRFLEEFDDLTRNFPKGCTTGQGYLFGKAAPAEVTNEALRKEAGRQAVAISTKLKRA